MLERFKKILQTEFDHFHEKELFLAISGGKDSMVLSDLLLKAGYKHTLLHCNFKLRGAESDLDEEFILNYANQHHLPVFTQTFDTASEAQAYGLTIQETARKLRYDWFRSFIREKNQVLLTAHHQSDSVETFFINLMRGTGIKGLAGIPQKRNDIFRPLLHFTRADIERYVLDHQIKFREDSSNAENKYLRNNLRNSLIPQFEDLSPNFSQKVAHTIESLNALSNWVEKQAAAFKNEHLKKTAHALSIDLNKLQSQDSAFLEFVLADFGIHRSNLIGFVHYLNAETGAQFITQSHCFTLNRGAVLITPMETKATNYELPILKENLPLHFQTPFATLSFVHSTTIAPFTAHNEIQQLDFDKIKFPLLVRNWKNGDRIHPLGMTGTKLISDILIDKKVPLPDKQNRLILADSENTILALLGLVVSEKVKITETTHAVLQIGCFALIDPI